ncbi:hypothetical protein EBB07_31300 [Paenibacillaceae bacterium]|nr:hypothetical protein EBB07_31300 [Paenibacillaceae bacterium]
MYISFQFGNKFLIVFFSLLSVINLIFITLLCIDLFGRETEKMKVIVIEIDNKNIKVLKPNGKARRIRILKQEINSYQINQEIELIITKRTKQILSINRSTDYSGSDSFRFFGN